MENILRNKLIGEQLGSIEFVMDYLQMHFDGKTFTLYIWPEIIIDINVIVYSDKNYKNEICNLLGYEIINISFIEHEYMELYFKENPRKIKINLNPNNPEIVSEIALFNDNNDGTWFVFE